MYQDMIFPVKCKHPEIDSVPSRQEVTTSSLNVMDLERMPGPQKRELSLLRPPEVSVRSKLHSSLRQWKYFTKSFWIHRSVNPACTLSATWNRECLVILWGLSLLYKDLDFIIVSFSQNKSCFGCSSPSPLHPPLLPCVVPLPVSFVLFFFFFFGQL